MQYGYLTKYVIYHQLRFVVLHLVDVLEGDWMIWHIQYCYRNSNNNNLLSHHKHSLMQGTLFVCRLGSCKEDIAADSLALAHEDMLASVFDAWLE